MQLEPLKNFFDEFSKFADKFKQLHLQENELKNKIQQIKTTLSNSSQFEKQALSSDNKLALSISELTNSLQAKFSDWDKNIADASPMQNLSKKFEDKIIFLVFGKVNAGKSSFSNQVVELYKSLFPKDTIRYFALTKSDEIIPLEGQFEEGFTETTAQIQGVELGNYFVLLDSPGLHSTVEKNGALTMQFIDSADAVLWLTSSDSPGQVQELDELKTELEKEKPLLPVITRSDKKRTIGWDEEAKEPKKVLEDKTPENRQMQEEDVYQRLQDYGKNQKLADVKHPISISVVTYKKVHQDLEKSGLARLFDEMANLVKKATDYKGQKADKQVENFINKHVISFLNGEIKTQIASISSQSTNVLNKLNKDRDLMTEIVKNHVISHLYQIVNKHKDSRNKNAIVQEVNSLVATTLSQEVSSRLSGFVDSLTQVSLQIDGGSIKGFEDRTISYQQERGAGKKSLAQAGGAAAGMAAGAALGSIVPGIGNLIGGAIGGLLGGLFGGAAGEALIETETVTEVVGVDTEQMEDSLKAQVSNGVKQTVDRTVDNLIAQIQPLKNTCDSLEREVNQIINQFAK